MSHDFKIFLQLERILNHMISCVMFFVVIRPIRDAGLHLLHHTQNTCLTNLKDYPNWVSNSVAIVVHSPLTAVVAWFNWARHVNTYFVFLARVQ